MASTVGTSTADSADVTTEALLAAAAVLAPVGEDQMEVDPQQQLATEVQPLRPAACSRSHSKQSFSDAPQTQEQPDKEGSLAYVLRRFQQGQGQTVGQSQEELNGDDDGDEDGDEDKDDDEDDDKDDDEDVVYRTR